MNKIRKLQFKNHPVLKDLVIDFCDLSGESVNTVIIAGENGTGKSTVVDALYKIITGELDFEAELEVEVNGIVHHFTYYKKVTAGNERIWIKDNEGLDTIPSNNSFFEKYQLNGIFSDVDINFSSQNISSVTSMVLDAESRSRRSNDNMPRQIKQLLIDIQSLDDAELSLAHRQAKKDGMDTNNIKVEERIPRFTNAFNKMF